MLSHLLVLIACELCILILVIKVSVEASLEGEAIHDVELSPHYYPCRLQLGLLKTEPARVIAELLGLLSYKLWYDSHLQIVRRVKRFLGPVNEDIFLARMPVHIYESQDLLIHCIRLILLLLLDFIRWPIDEIIGDLLDGTDSWVESEIGLVVPPVQVVT